MSIHHNYLPNADADKVIWLNNFSVKIALYASLVGITAAELAAIVNDAKMFQYIMTIQEIYKQNLQTLTGYKSLLKHAVAQQHLGAIPVLPVLPTAPALVSEGVFDRVSGFAQRIKASVNYTTNMGQDLGIIAPVVVFDPTTLQPLLTVKLDATRPHIKWIKDVSDALDLYADHNDGNGFTLLGRLNRNEYIDITNLTATKAIDEWHYKAIYVIADQQVGLYSSVVDIMVKKP
ncbi:MAG: hypothetical protein ABI448_08745 [Bacteroidia bacterium]